MSNLAPSTTKYAMAALRERRAEMSGQLTKLEAQIRHLKASMIHLDATLRLMDPDRDPNEIPSKRPYVRTKLFDQAASTAWILPVLR